MWVVTVTDKPAGPDFLSQADPYRRELLAHCYRMLGSVHDAEDLVQETMLRAWRAYDRFEGRSTLRTWLYRIATSACLTALESRGRRPLPTGLGGPSETGGQPLDVRDEVPWLEPMPGGVEASDDADPAAIVTARESMRLAFVAALQHLPARQRAVLILRDVLAWRAAEVAELLDTTTAAVNSALQRARAQLDEVAPKQDEVVEPTGGGQARAARAVRRRVRAQGHRGDRARCSREDAVWEMPPFSTWFRGPGAGRAAPDRPVSRRPRRLPVRVHRGQRRTRARNVPARGRRQVFRPFSLQVFTVSGSVFSHVVSFFDLRLFDTFGLPSSR